MDVFWLCDGCRFAGPYADFNTYSHQANAGSAPSQTVRQLLADLAPVSADFDPDLGWGIQAVAHSPCAGCGTCVPGSRHRFTRL